VKENCSQEEESDVRKMMYLIIESGSLLIHLRTEVSAVGWNTRRERSPKRRPRHRLPFVLIGKPPSQLESAYPAHDARLPRRGCKLEAQEFTIR